jgi:hypothetical protein
MASGVLKFKGEAMKKRQSASQFQECIKSLDVGQQTVEIARGVLVHGQPQATFVSSLRLTKGAISHAVNRVWAAYEANTLPDGYERVSVVLPEHQAYRVRQWAKDAAKKLEIKS